MQKKVKVLLSSLVVLLLLSVIVTAGCVTDEKKTYVVAFDPALHPFSVEDIFTGEPEGFDVKMLDWIAKDQGLDLTYELASYKEFLDVADKDVYDLKPSIAKTVNRADEFTFTDVYMNVGYAVIVRKDSDLEANDITSGTVKVAVAADSSYLNWLKKYFGDEKCNKLIDEGIIIVKPSVDKAVYSVAVGEADATMCSSVAAVTQTQNFMALKYAGCVDGTVEIRILTKPGNDKLIESLNKGIANFLASPEYNEYLDEFDMPYQKDVYTVGIDSNNAPFTYLDANGDLTGFDYDSIMWIADKYGFEVKFVDSTEDKSVTGILNEKYDMWYSGLEYPAEPSNMVTLSNPYTVGSTEYVVEIHNGDVTLMDIINDGLADMKAEGKYDQLVQKYF